MYTSQSSTIAPVKPTTPLVGPGVEKTGLYPVCPKVFESDEGNVSSTTKSVLVLPSRAKRVWATLTLLVGNACFVYLGNGSGFTGLYFTGPGSNCTINKDFPWNGEVWFIREGTGISILGYTEVYVRP